MKKGATLTSGILTTILFFIFFALSVLLVCTALDVSAVVEVVNGVDILQKLVVSYSYVAVAIIPILLAKFIPTIPVTMVTQILTFVSLAFSLWMFIWGIKEIKISKRDDAEFVKCNKTCAFMMFLKFVIFLYFLAILLLALLLEEIKIYTAFFFFALGLQDVYLIIFAVLVVISFLLFILPSANFHFATKKYNAQNEQGFNNQDVVVNSAGQEGLGQTFNTNPQQTMQANMPPLPNYRPANLNDQNMASQQVVQPQFQPQAQPMPTNISQPQANNYQPVNNSQQAVDASQAGGIVPGQDGVPLNITQKGIADLERLIRLRAMGAVNDANYEAMRQKIFTTEIS